MEADFRAGSWSAKIIKRKQRPAGGAGSLQRTCLLPQFPVFKGIYRGNPPNRPLLAVYALTKPLRTRRFPCRFPKTWNREFRAMKGELDSRSRATVGAGMPAVRPKADIELHRLKCRLLARSGPFRWKPASYITTDETAVTLRAGQPASSIETPSIARRSATARHSTHFR